MDAGEKKAMGRKQPKMADRRHFLSAMAQGIGISALGAIVWTGHVEKAAAAPLVLRPPAALKGDNFLRACIKCGLCVEACPYDALMIAGPGDNKPMGTPYFIPRMTPCHMCPDIPCLPVCPAGALNPDLLVNKTAGKKAPDINQARMGVALIDRQSCIASWGLQCDICYRACPLLGKAITIDFMRNKRTGKHAKLLPVVHPDQCTGCGMCEHACVTEKASIFVLPREVAMRGRAGDFYVMGWSSLDQERVKQRDLTKLKTTTERSRKSPQDYLNEGVPHD